MSGFARARFVMAGAVVFSALIQPRMVAAAEISVNGTLPPATLSVPAGSTVTVQVSGGPANTKDSVRLYVVGFGFTEAWQYLNGTQTVPATGVSSATLTFTLPEGAGDYQFRFYANGSTTLLATSSTVTTTSSYTEPYCPAYTRRC